MSKNHSILSSIVDKKNNLGAKTADFGTLFAYHRCTNLQDILKKGPKTG